MKPKTINLSDAAHHGRGRYYIADGAEADDEDFFRRLHFYTIFFYSVQNYKNYYSSVSCNLSLPKPIIRITE